ncbi:hypothetical protein ACFL0W_02900 [Nanoarchaeota archaeon]
MIPALEGVSIDAERFSQLLEIKEGPLELELRKKERKEGSERVMDYKLIAKNPEVPEALREYDIGSNYLSEGQAHYPPMTNLQEQRWAEIQTSLFSCLDFFNRNLETYENYTLTDSAGVINPRQKQASVYDRGELHIFTDYLLSQVTAHYAREGVLTLTVSGAEAKRTTGTGNLLFAVPLDLD